MEKIIYKSVNEFINADFNDFLIDINPQIASEMLAKSCGNRKPNESNIKALYNDMMNDEYYYDVPGSGIAFDKNGLLINGHHTLMAVKESNTTQTICLRLGVRPSHNEKTDTGSSRTLKDTLSMCKKNNLIPIRGVAVNILRDKYNILKSSTGYKKEILLSEVLSFSEEHQEELINLINDFDKKKKEVCCNLIKYRKLERGYFCSLIYLLQQYYDKDLVNTFMYGIISSKESKYKTIENFRNKVDKDSRKTLKMGAWTFPQFEEKVNSNFKKFLKEVETERYLENVCVSY